MSLQYHCKKKKKKKEKKGIEKSQFHKYPYNCRGKGRKILFGLRSLLLTHISCTLAEITAKLFGAESTAVWA